MCPNDMFLGLAVWVGGLNMLSLQAEVSLAVSMLGVRCSRIFDAVSPGKLINQPLSAACRRVSIGGAPEHL